MLFGVETDTYDVMGLVQPRRCRATTTATQGARAAQSSSDDGGGGERNGECESEAKRKRRELEQVDDGGEKEEREEEETAVDDEHTNKKKQRRYAPSDDGTRLETEDEAEEGPGAREIDEEVVKAVMPFFVGKRSQVHCLYLLYPPCLFCCFSCW